MLLSIKSLQIVRVRWILGISLAGLMTLFLSGCLPVAPPPMISPINSAAMQLSEKPTAVLSQRAGLATAGNAAYFLTHAGRSFDDHFAAEASVGFGKGFYDKSERRAPQPEERSNSGEQILGAIAWLASGRFGGVYEISGPFKVSGGLGYGQADQGLHYLSADTSIALAGYLTPNLWATCGGGLYYTQLINAGRPTYISDRGSYSLYEKHERHSVLGLTTSTGLGYWFSDNVGFSAGLNLAINTPLLSNNAEETWPIMGISVGLHFRFDPE